MKFIPCGYCKGGYREGDEEGKERHKHCKQRHEYILNRRRELDKK